MRLSKLILFLAVVLTGFDAGIGFGNAIGYMPGFEDTPTSHVLSYWQNVDHYFRARMPIFGNAMLASLVLSIVFFRRKWKELSFWLLTCALLLAIGDLIVILSVNLPLNETMQKLNPDTVTSDVFEPIRQDALKAYYHRSIFTIGTFVATCLAALYADTSEAQPVAS